MAKGAMEVFRQAHVDFLKQLPDDEKAQFEHIKTSDDFLASLSRLGQFEKTNKKWSRLVGIVKSCADKLNPYFEVVGTTIQSNPEIASLVWGAFRLVLVLASNYGTFFERLGELIRKLSSKIPAYNTLLENVAKGFEEDCISPGCLDVTERFQSSLQAFYQDLFEIFRSIARVFTKRDGRLKKTPVVIGELLWQPFHVRFSNILQRLDIHGEILALEIHLLNIRIMSHMNYQQIEDRRQIEELGNKLGEYNVLLGLLKQRFGERERGDLYQHIRSWLMSPPFADVLERLQTLRFEGTSEWILLDERFSSSVIKTSESLGNFVWVRGNPGTGKSVLAASLIRGMWDRPEPVAYYFFEYNGNDGVPAPREFAYRAILCQLLHQMRDNESILEVFSFAYTNSKHGQPNASSGELLDLIKTVSYHVGKWQLVIDAADECQDADGLVLDLVRTLGGLQAQVVIFSRPNVRALLKNIKSPSQILTVNRKVNEHDLRLYLDYHLENLQETGTIPSHVPRDTLLEHLVTGADGMFQWARLMVCHLQSDGLLPSDRLDIITRLKSPERLDDMYMRILHLLKTKLTSEQSLSRSLFQWLTYSKRPMRVTELRDLVATRKTDDVDQSRGICQVPRKEELVNFDTITIMVSGGLIEKRKHPQTQEEVYAYVHGSVFEFFKDKCESTSTGNDSRHGTVEYFFPSEADTEAELFLKSISYIIERVPHKPLSGSLFKAASPDALRDQLPFIGYAALYWPYHLLGMKATLSSQPSPASENLFKKLRQVCSTLGNFLLNRLLPMVWVELKYTFEIRSKAHESLHEPLLAWAGWVEEVDPSFISPEGDGIPQAIAAFARDLISLHQLWGDTLLSGPHEIWNDITAFTNSPFFVTTAAVTFKSLTDESSKMRDRSTAPLSKISQDDASTNLLAILTVWPPRSFEVHWKSSAVKKRLKLPDECFTGWVAQYELWNIEADDPYVQETSFLPIATDEVRTQFERFRKFSSSVSRPTERTSKTLALHFPTSICEDLNSFTVLRTVYSRSQTSCAVAQRTGVECDSIPWDAIKIPVRHTINATLLEGIERLPRPPSDDDTHEAESGRTKHPLALRFGTTPGFRILLHHPYALYQSVDVQEGLGEDDTAAGTTAVYQLDQWKSDCEPRLIGCIEGDSSCRSISHCVFHPELPLVAFSYQNKLGHVQIMLWSFCTTDPSGAFKPIHHSSLLPTKSGIGTSCVATIGWRLKLLQFTSCGKKLVYLRYGSPVARVIDIDQSVAFQQALAQGSPHAKAKPTASEEDMADMKRENSMTLFSEVPSAITANRPVLADDGSLSRCTVDIGNSGRNVQIIRSQGADTTARPLLSLPAWTDVKTLTASIRMPTRSHEDKITIILNKTAQPFYEIGGNTPQTSPAVVRKDIRAVAPSVTVTATERGNLEASTSSRSSSADEDGLEGPRKRRRVAPS